MGRTVLEGEWVSELERRGEKKSVSRREREAVVQAALKGTQWFTPGSGGNFTVPHGTEKERENKIVHESI